MTFEPPTIYLYNHTENHFNYRRTDVTPYLFWDVDAETQSGNQYLQELEHFCHCVKTGDPPLVTGRDGRHGVEIINATYLSYFENKWIELPVTDTSRLPAYFEQYQKEQLARRNK